MMQVPKFISAKVTNTSCQKTQKLFNIKKVTLFENSKIGLTKWLEVIYYITARKNGVGINNASFGKDSVIEVPIPENSYLVNFRGNGKFCIISEEKFNRDFTIISKEHSKCNTI